MFSSAASREQPETILVPRHYGGHFIGFVQREDLGGAMRKLAVLGRIADFWS